ncbi:MAG: SDR family NAD(P)-dependent oxidoreductase, partial [Planctomycetota bacterium]|nr:SDR family NAD(P)-dependent oxidoreductase [Planctomycetota bacterium]
MSILAGRVALVTGGSKGIGAAIVRALADAGASVVSTSRSGGRDAGRVRQVKADVRNADDAARAVEEAVTSFGGLDILVNNAG